MSEATPSLADRTTHAVAWRFLAKAASFGLRFGVLVLLARLVAVESFGLAAQALLVIGLTTLLSEIGMAPALIQRRELTETHVRVAFTVSILSGMLLTGVLWLSAPLVAALFQSPDLV